MMEVSAKSRRLRISAQKARLVADQVRGKPVADALDIPDGTVKSRLNRGLAELRKRKEVTGES